MTERRNLGDLLTDVGRIEREDVDRALEYQAEHGGYFGQALIALGIVSPEELEWGLASQFDLPYVFPEPDSIDPEAAWLVPPEWALANLALPIAKTRESVTVVIDSPNKKGALEDLERRIDSPIDLAIASPAKIRELIRRVYSTTRSDPAEGVTSVTLVQGFGLALGAAADRFGVSVRGHTAVFWWLEGGRVRRRPLDGLWRQDLDTRIVPAPSTEIDERPRARFEASLTWDGRSTPVEVDYLADPNGAEYLLRPMERADPLWERFDNPPPDILAEVRLLVRSGSARFLVRTDPDALGPEILRHLPTLLHLDGRTVFVHGVGRAGEDGVFSVEMPADPEAWAGELEALGAFHFDVAGIDLPLGEGDWLAAALAASSVTFLLGDALADLDEVREAGVEWLLEIGRAEGHLRWSLEPLPR